MSKREQAALEFAAQVRSRTGDALIRYFMSHGVYVRQYDHLPDATALEGHQRFLASVANEFDATNRAIMLASDIRSLSLAEKEKAMLAVYSIEQKCASNLGLQGALADAAASLSQAVSAWPTPPSWTAPFLTALAGAICLYMNWGALGVGLLILALAFGAFRLQGYLKRKRFIEEVVADINKRFDSLLSVEISARPSLPETAGNPPLKAAGFAAVALVVAGFAWVSSPPHLSPMSAAQKPTQAAASKRHDAENASRREATSQASARRKDKAQSDATTTADPAATRTAPRNAIRASFDCTKAQSNAERIICSDPQLASADVELAALFANARAAVSDQDTFRERARAAWRYREKNCHDRECLVRWYADEGTVLRHIAQTGDPAAD